MKVIRIAALLRHWHAVHARDVLELAAAALRQALRSSQNDSCTEQGPRIQR